MSEKRNDLQGIRGIAILLVLIFHLKPNLFPYGFIGVDMFFVLSGYLMTMILSKKLMNSNVLLDFYTRRFKRIVPLFACILFGVYLVGWYYLMQIDRVQLLTDLKWSLTFTSNVQPLFETKGYWDQVLSYRFLVHCWSLGVEIQFYVIAPFVVGYCREKKWNYLVYILFGCSFIFQLVAPPRISYGMLPSRIWQFLCGTIAYDLEKKLSSAENYQKVPDDEEALLEGQKPNGRKINLAQEYPYITYIRESFALFLIALVFINPQFLRETGMRVIGTFLTTSFICSGKLALFSFVSLKPLVYIGDISYTLYLVHWPTIVFYKYYNSLTDLSVNEILWCLAVMFTLSIVIHHTLESYLVRSRLFVGFLLFICCILVISVTSPIYEKERELTAQERENENAKIIEKAIHTNLMEDQRRAEEPQMNNPNRNYRWVPCRRDKEAEKWMHWTIEPQLRCVTKSNGTLNVLVVGNSIAYRAFPTIHSLFKGRFKTMRLSGKSTLPGIYASPESRPESAAYETAVKLLVENFQPDVIFVVYTSLGTSPHHFDGRDLQSPVVDWKNDAPLQHLQRNFDFYSNHSRRIVIDLPYYINPSLRYAQEVNKRLKLGKSLDDLKITKQDLYNQQHWQHERLKHLNCSTCIFNDVSESLFNGEDTFYFYDRKTYLAYLADGIHFSQAGLKLIRDRYAGIIEKIIKELS